jgi:hypothetical protein
MRDYFEKLCSNKLENLKEINNLLDTYDNPKLNQDDINEQNGFIALSEIEAPIKSLPKKVQDLMDSLLNSTRPLKKN